MRRTSAITNAARTRGGFTLLELLIASVLIAMLMAAVWGLMSLYSSFLVAGRNQAAEQQLSRSLMDLVATDLRASLSLRLHPATSPATTPANPNNRLATTLAVSRPIDTDSVPIGPEPSTGVEPLPEITLTGNEHSLTLISVRHEPQFDLSRLQGEGPSLLTGDMLDPEADTPSAGSTAGLGPDHAVAPEWTQVIYRFIPPQSALRDDPELAPGLHRFEIPIEFLGLLAQDNEPGAGLATGLAGPSLDPSDEFSADLADSIQLLLDQQVPGVTHEHVPEVVACRFEYFSGSTWQRNWAPTAAYGRPLAVRVSLRLLSPEESRGLSALLGSEDVAGQPIDQTEAAATMIDSAGAADPFDAFQPRLYRRTIVMDVDRDALQWPDGTPQTEESLASSQWPSGAE